MLLALDAARIGKPHRDILPVAKSVLPMDEHSVLPPMDLAHPLLKAGRAVMLQPEVCGAWADSVNPFREKGRRRRPTQNAKC